MRDELQKEERVNVFKSLVRAFKERKRRGSPWLLVPLCALLIFFALNARYFFTVAKFQVSPPAQDQSVDADASPLVAPNQLSIPRLGIEAPIQYVEENSEAVFQDALMEGVVHYPGTAMPGELGNVYIFGHSSDLAWKRNPYATVFALLPQIKPGDEIIISDAQGKAMTYIAQDTVIVNPSDVEVLSQFDYQKKMLTLQTSYPLGTALQRFIVTAILKE